MVLHLYTGCLSFLFMNFTSDVWNLKFAPLFTFFLGSRSGQTFCLVGVSSCVSPPSSLSRSDQSCCCCCCRSWLQLPRSDSAHSPLSYPKKFPAKCSTLVLFILQLAGSLALCLLSGSRFPLSFLSPSRSLLPSSVSHKASGGVRISSCRDAPLQRQTRREALRRPAQKSV